MIKIRKVKNKYEGFTLVEMLITIAILGIIMIISSTVLTTLIRVSIVANDKIRARNESEFVLELMRRTVRNSNPADVYIFNSLYQDNMGRWFDPELEEFHDRGEIGLVYENVVGENQPGNEIQFRPYGFQDWICLGFFETDPDEEEVRGYLLWSSGRDLVGNHQSCFGDPDGPYGYLMVLNSEYINIKNFEIYYTLSPDANYVITFNILSEPVHWYLARGAPVNREVFRQTVVSTEGVLW